MVILESFEVQNYTDASDFLAMYGDLPTHPVTEVILVLLKSGQSASQEEAVEEMKDYLPVRFRVQIGYEGLAQNIELLSCDIHHRIVLTACVLESRTRTLILESLGTMPSLGLFCELNSRPSVHSARSLRSDRAPARARSLRSDRAEHAFGCCVATLFELLSDDSRFLRKAFRKEESISKKYLSKKFSMFSSSGIWTLTSSQPFSTPIVWLVKRRLIDHGFYPLSAMNCTDALDVLAMYGDLPTHSVTEVIPVLLKTGQSASQKEAVEEMKDCRSMKQHWCRSTVMPEYGLSIFYDR
ncbi:hypothetical protein DY000_02060789 [Brassica cretica]|uniref:Uncharacterized protein n=1 Tax=Brassica cretica TaxID=69181 RepID=A0ABQ7AU90_BRACR|nr:hypothetical protein DY000_02060789 [Brassica cretica]